MLKLREVDAIIIYQVDRLSRDIVDLLASVRDGLKIGIEIHSCDIGNVESEIDIVLVIKGWHGSDERKKIAERTARGRYAKAKAGKVVGGGYMPYGYTYASGAFVIVEAETKIVRLIFHWYINGDADGKRLASWTIARRLSEMGIPTPNDTRGKKRRRPPGLWDSSN